ncbi:MAG: Hsp70 family protein [Proteobacteria bacterium]|nr:Hsp70 family protein [Pseudomonadota bacterium]
MTKTPESQMLYAGFDLGTTNSTAALFDGEQIVLARNSSGGNLTPSVVRMDGKGRISVGLRARRFLDSDPDNTHTEFKRLMGTGKKLEFPAAGAAKLPEELAALVLESMRDDIRDQLGVAPARAVISVPALFELPQNSATSEAARMAGFEQVELLQEPIASALAAGWKVEEATGTWMVYDIGGGTFDVSLLETRDGLLRVVGHDGDNFLGGRDFDAAIVDWILVQLADGGISLNRDNPDHKGALRALKQAAEEAKIELSRAEESVISLPAPIEIDGREIDPELSLARVTVEQICTPVFERTMAVCRRLLEAKGLSPDQLERIVLVGGPTVMPMVRSRVGDEFGAPIAEGCDPMTLVAQGAAIYAATAGLDARSERGNRPRAQRGCRLWLQFPPVSADLTPHVVGRVMDRDKTGNAAKNDPQPAVPARIRLVRGDGKWTSPVAEIDREGGFVLITDLVPRRPNVFKLDASAADGTPVEVFPDAITIVQGITISDPPLSRSVGVALANDHVHVYFERGAALPTRRTFTHYTVESVARGSDESVLKIPIVQGEFDRAHLCRLVGTLEIKGDEIETSVPSGSPVEVTIELDRGGRLAATALVPSIDQMFEQVAHLLVPNADPDALEASLEELHRRIVEVRTEAFRNGWTDVLGPLDGTENRLTEVARDVAASRGGDEDAGQKARRALIELDAIVVEAEFKRQWPELEEKALHDLAWASNWVAQYGTPAEVRLIDEISAAVETARAAQNPGELERQLRLARRLGQTAFYRHPSAWEWMFEGAASEIATATDLPRAQELVRKGRQAIESNDSAALRGVVENLWKLLPADVKTRRLSFDSGVR